MQQSAGSSELARAPAPVRDVQEIAPELLDAGTLASAPQAMRGPLDTASPNREPEAAPRPRTGAGAGPTELGAAADSEPAGVTPQAPVIPPAIVGMSSASDGGLTIVNAPSDTSKLGERTTARASDASSGARERGRAAALGAADHRVLARGIHAKVDLGEGGRVVVHAESAKDETIAVKLDADVAHTARALSEHARSLAVELRSEAREARVTVTGPGTQSSVSSSGTQGGGGSGDSSSWRHDGDGRDARAAYAQGSEPRDADRGATPRISRRARFVL